MALHRLLEVPQVIPAEAVEAALSALLPDSDIDSLKGGFWWGNVETILEAAAPHIIAGYFREINSKAIAHELENPPNFSKDAP